MKLPTTLFKLLLFIPALLICLQSCKEKAKDTSAQEAATTTDNSDGFTPIFDGTSLTHWEGNPVYWRVEDGAIVGEITPETKLKANTFLIYSEGPLADFELKAEFRISESGNSGIQYRSERLDTIPFALRGYQADIDGKHRYTGQNYEERKRTTLAYRGEKAVISSQENPDPSGNVRSNVKNNAWQSREVVETLGHIDSLKTHINAGWNECHLIIKGNRLQHYVNGTLMSDVIDEDAINRSASGHLGMQVHVGPPMKVAYRNIRLKKL